MVLPLPDRAFTNTKTSLVNSAIYESLGYRKTRLFVQASWQYSDASCQVAKIRQAAFLLLRQCMPSGAVQNFGNVYTAQGRLNGASQVALRPWMQFRSFL